jgi:hypothetical protein
VKGTKWLSEARHAKPERPTYELRVIGNEAPRAIDLEGIDGKQWVRGLFSVDGETFTLSFNSSLPSDTRPTSLDPKGDPDQVALTFLRAGAKCEPPPEALPVLPERGDFTKVDDHQLENLTKSYLKRFKNENALAIGAARLAQKTKIMAVLASLIDLSSREAVELMAETAVIHERESSRLHEILTRMWSEQVRRIIEANSLRKAKGLP